MGRLTPFVGREIEITVLLERWAEANDGEGQVVLLSGEPGIGKSRITQELQQRLAAEPHTWLRYQGTPSYTNTASYPVIDHFERAAGFARDDTPESRLDKLEALLKRCADNVAETAPLFASLLSLPLDRYLPLALSPQQQKEKTFQVLADQILEFARHKPVLLVVEDAHWIDPTTLDVISTIIDRLHNAAILLVVTYRPEFEPPWHSYSNVTVHSLNRLSRRQSVHMLAKLVGAKKLSADVLDQIIAKTDGIPLFVEELTKTVLETRHGTVDSIAAIPATLQDSLMARLDRLALGKEIAQICACIGREFSYSLIAAVADDDISDLNDALTKLIDAELLYQRGRPPNATYSFKHALVQETAYQSQLKTRRQQIHGRIAHALQTQFSEIVAAEPELMAYHYTQTGLNDQALPYWQLAGERAVQKSTNIESVYHFRAALDALQSIPENIERNRQELNLQVALAVPLATTTGFASAEMEPVYQRARELCEEVGETPLLRSRPNTALPTG